MKTAITKKDFGIAEMKMNELLALATKRGGFNYLTTKEKGDLNKYTKIVSGYEEANYTISLPQTLPGLIELKMYEKKLKQKELAKMLKVTDTKLSEIMHNKRKPNLSFLKAMNEILGIDGNLLLRIA